MIRLWLLFLICCTDVQAPDEVEPYVMEELKLLAKELDLWHRPDGWGKWKNEIRWCRDRWADVCDCPPSWDVHRFPKVPDDWNKFVDEHYQWADVQQKPEFYMAELRRRNMAWQTLYYAQRNGETAWTRTSLRWLRELLGADAYFAGQMPDPVPWECFGRME